MMINIHSPTDRIRNTRPGALVVLLCLVLGAAWFIAPNAGAADPVSKADRKCVMCHRKKSFQEPPPAGEEWQVHITATEFQQEPHQQLSCRSCHVDILKTPHRKNVARGVDCVSCHRRHPDFVLRDAQGGRVIDSGQPLSTMNTCGHCHDTEFVARSSDHSDAGASRRYSSQEQRNWVAGPGYFGGWDVIRYNSAGQDLSGSVDVAGWLKESGRYHVGGGPAAALTEMDCLLCHSSLSDHSERNTALQSGNFAWANSASLQSIEVLQSADGGWSWNPDMFREDGSLKIGVLEIDNPDSTSCGRCHGLVGVDVDQPLVLEDDIRAHRMTARSGQIIAPHPLSTEGLGVEFSEGGDHPLDVHAASGLNCADCHYSLNHPVYYQADEEDSASHLNFDPRRMDISDYLSRPLHQFAKGRSIHGLAAEQSINSLRRCASCHDAEPVHQWLPYPERHFNALACETCHVPRVYGPALQAIDWTMLDANGAPLIQMRGMAAEAGSGERPIQGFTPLLLPRVNGDGKAKLTPFNMVVGWYWLAGDPPYPVSHDELKAALLQDGKHHPSLIQGLDRNDDGELTGDELELRSAEQQAVVRQRLEDHGLWPLTVDSDVLPFSINHNVVGGQWATRECNSCHHRDSMLGAAFQLSDYLPGGQAPVGEYYSSVEYSRHVQPTETGGLAGIPDPSMSGFYVMGHDSVVWIDWIGLLAVLGVIGGVSAHGTARYITNRRRGKAHFELKRVYMYDVYDRLWHWLQALTILALLATGLIMHKPHLFGWANFSWMVDIHNILGFVMLANAALALFYNFASGSVKRFLPEPKDFFGRAIAQTMYYTKGIFSGEPHPLEKTKEDRLNPLQQLTYLAILNVLLPIQVITGLMIYWGQQNWPIFFTSLGGLPVLAPVHTLVAWLFAAFIIMHVYLTTAGGHTPTAGIKSMITGWDDVETHASKDA